MVFVKNSDEGVFSPHFTAKSIVRWRSYPSSVGYAATFSPGGEGFCYSSKVSLCVYILDLSSYSARQPLPSSFAPKNGHKKDPRHRQVLLWDGISVCKLGCLQCSWFYMRFGKRFGIRRSHQF